MNDIVIRGRIANPDEKSVEGWVGIEGEYISDVSQTQLHGRTVIELREEELIFPGFIDPHVHMREPGDSYKENYYSGARAAIAGGVTAVLDMPNNSLPTTSRERVEEKLRLSERVPIDVYLLGGVGAGTLDQVEAMADSGVVGFKVYMGPTTGDLLLRPEEEEEVAEALSKIGNQTGANTIPVLYHCEDSEVIKELEGEHTEETSPRVHCMTRPWEAETVALKRALQYGEKNGNPVSICHLSTKEGLDLVREYRERGNTVYCEVTPHHLTFTEEDMEDSRLKMNPPLRGIEDVEALWEGISRGDINFLGSDHAPHTTEEKAADIRYAPAGIPGLDTYGPFVSRMDNDIDPSGIARLTSTNAAEFFGFHHMGFIKPGYLASLTVMNMNDPHEVNGPYQTRSGWSPYQGMNFTGRPSYVFVRGHMLMKNGVLIL